MEWLLAVEFQHNDKKHSAIGCIPFELKLGQLWKGDLTIETKLPKLKTFLEELWRSWKIAKTLIEKANEAMKKQFNKKRQNPQGLK